ncbi:MAG: DUF5020 family protein [Verrucomicrobia bacterium]|nr:DUF5020 family protein [Prolixibacteraceae bacterium]
MKKLVLILLVCLLGVSSYGQNLQTHYDFGKDRGYLTTTVEMFRPDKTGNTFFFIDFDYGSNGVENSPSLAYFEIARVFALGKTGFGWHGEYNGGLFRPAPAVGASISNAWLTGVDYSWNAADFSKGFSLKALYKNIANTTDDKPHNFQLTAVWYYNFAKGKFSFTGFADLWREGHTVSNDGFKSNFQEKEFIFLTEPQLWYNCCKKFSIGTEVEISNNFAGHDGFMANPTAALKYTF